MTADPLHRDMTDLSSYPAADVAVVYALNDDMMFVACYCCHISLFCSYCSLTQQCTVTTTDIAIDQTDALMLFSSTMMPRLYLFATFFCLCLLSPLLRYCSICSIPVLIPFISQPVIHAFVWKSMTFSKWPIVHRWLITFYTLFTIISVLL